MFLSQTYILIFFSEKKDKKQSCLRCQKNYIYLGMKISKNVKILFYCLGYIKDPKILAQGVVLHWGEILLGYFMRVLVRT